MTRSVRRTAALMAAWAAIATPALLAASPGQLFLANGDKIEGAWAAGDAGEVLRWQAEFASDPFEFPWASVSHAAFPSPAEARSNVDGFQFELTGGGLITGDLIDASGDWFTVDVALDEGSEPLRVKLRRERVRRINNLLGEGELIYHGPGDLTTWKPKKPSDWKLAEAGFQTQAANASIWGDIGLTDRVRIELEVGWLNADFTLELGVPEAPPSEPPAKGDQRAMAVRLFARAAQPDPQPAVPQPSTAFKLEAIAGSLLAMRELKSFADLAVIQEHLGAERRLDLVLYLDQKAGRLIVTRPDGEVLADLTVEGPDTRLASGIRLSNRNGEVGLRRLRVSHWNGRLPSALGGGVSRVETADGRTLEAEVVGFDPESGEFRLRPTGAPASPEDDAVPATLPAAEVRTIVLSPNTAETDSPTLIALHDGTRLRGAPTEVVDETLRFQADALEEPITLPIVRLRSLRSISEPADAATPPQSDVVRLQTTDSGLQGILSGGPADSASSCLVFRPLGSRTASAILNSVSGRLIFREPKPAKPNKPKANTPRVVKRQKGVIGAIADFLKGRPPSTATTPKAPPKPAKSKPAPVPSIAYLRDGDKLPCEVRLIDSEGVHLKTPFATTEFVRHEQVKAIELVTKGVDGRMTKERRERLLMLPRMQRDSPPTHLLVSKKGDYLRCRLIALNDAAATVEVRLEDRQIERSRIARIIWLDPPAEDESSGALDLEPAETSSGLRVQAVRSDGVRLTFELASLDRGEGDGTSEWLTGSSGVIGDCRAPIDEIDVLLLGNQIELAARDLSYQRWVMTPAPEPREDPQGGPGDGSEGSPLIGLAAPEVELPWARGEVVVENDPFTVAGYRGKVLVLDFWASWCGPCVQAMPIVASLEEEFAEQGVEFVAVNLQESPAEVAAALDRMAIDPPVALDPDGVAAQRYQVTGIPRTVVIDREGIVSHVLVGGGDGFEERLREALSSVTGE